MKKLLTITLVIVAFNGYAQWPSLPVSSAPQIRNNIMYAVNRAADSLGKLLRAEFKAGDAANAKALADSLKAIPPIDNKTIVVSNGVAVAVGATTDLKPVYDSIGKVDTRLTSINKSLTDNINIVSGRTTTLENKVSSVDSQLTTINSKIATIPTKAVSVSTTTTTTTLQQ